MAVLAGNQVQLMLQNGDIDRMSLIAARNVTAGDTLDLAGYGFTAVKQCTGVCPTANAAAVLSVNGTVVTMPAGLSHDALVLTVWGCAG
jgi:hypothetical protein